MNTWEQITFKNESNKSTFINIEYIKTKKYGNIQAHINIKRKYFGVCPNDNT